MENRSDNQQIVVVVRRDLRMPREKLAAQVGHAVQYAMMDGIDHKALASGSPQEVPLDLRAWLQDGYSRIVVVYADNGVALETLVQNVRYSGMKAHPVVDKGLTVFNGKETLTCAAIGPHLRSQLAPLTGHLPTR